MVPEHARAAAGRPGRPAPGEVRGWGVFAHGFTLGKDCPAASRICKQLAGEGIGMLRFDNLGLGDSEGDWGDGSFSHKVADTVRAVEFMNGAGREVRLLVGHSFGGAAVDRRARTNAPTRGGGGQHRRAVRTRARRAQLRRAGRSGSRPTARRRSSIGGKALTLKRHFIEDVRAADLRERIRTLRRALLVMHSPTDNTVGIANASDIFRAARHPRSFVSLEGADHLLTGKNQAAAGRAHHQRLGRPLSRGLSRRPLASGRAPQQPGHLVEATPLGVLEGGGAVAVGDGRVGPGVEQGRHDALVRRRAVAEDHRLE